MNSQLLQRTLASFCFSVVAFAGKYHHHHYHHHHHHHQSLSSFTYLYFQTFKNSPFFPFIFLRISPLVLCGRAGVKGMRGELPGEEGVDEVKVFAMQLDMWAPPMDDVLIRYNLTDYFKEVCVCVCWFSVSLIVPRFLRYYLVW